MPFKSEAQRRYFHWAAEHGKDGITKEMAHEWEHATPKSVKKKLPYHVEKKAMDTAQESFLDELLKIAEGIGPPEPPTKSPGILDRMGGWMKKHPIATAGLVAAPVAGGMLARNALRTPTAYGLTSKALQSRAAEKGVGIVMSAGTSSVKGSPTIKDRVMSGLLLGGGAKPIYTTAKDIDHVLQESRPLVSQGVVTSGLDLPKGKLRPMAEMAYHGGQEAYSRGAKSTRTAMNELIQGGKGMEANDTGLQHLFSPTSSVSDLAKKHGITIPKAEAGPEAHKTYLRQLQAAASKEYASSGDEATRDFFLKPHDISDSAGRFANKKHDWGELYHDYQTRLKPKMESLRKEVKDFPEEYAGAHPDNIVSSKLRDDPAYVGLGLENAIHNPDKAILQKKAPIVDRLIGDKPVEYRVHAIGGDVPNELAYDRYSHINTALGRIPGVKHIRPEGYGSADDAAKFVREQVLPSMNKKYHKGTFGLDVMRIKKPDGTYGYQLVEMNPAGYDFLSGYLDPQINPMGGHDTYRYLTGKDTPLIAGAKAVGAGGAVGGAAYSAAAPTAKKERGEA